ncbi:MAG: M42 family metallopeptidase [Anaerolineae bacterium]
MIEVLHELSEAVGVSGEEGEVRALILRHIREHADDIQLDALGNVIALKRGTGASRLRVMAAAHMDEVGMMVMGFDSDGSIRFDAVGGLDARILPGVRVWVGPDKIPGVIAWTPIHLNKDQGTVPIDRLRIDIGAANRDAAQKAVSRGDRIAFASPFEHLGPTVRGKAFDDRAGCASLIRLLQGERFPFELYAVFTVQEEVGLRGARAAAGRILPDVAFVLETTACHDLPQDPDEPDQTTITRLGNGPAITVADRSMVSDPRLVRHLVRAGEAAGIPHQFRSPQHAGGTDAGAIHRTGVGVPSVVVANPCRYIHGPYAIMSVTDWENQAALLRAAWEMLDEGALRRG